MGGKPVIWMPGTPTASSQLVTRSAKKGAATAETALGADRTSWTSHWVPCALSMMGECRLPTHYTGRVFIVECHKPRRGNHVQRPTGDFGAAPSIGALAPVGFKSWGICVRTPSKSLVSRSRNRAYRSDLVWPSAGCAALFPAVAWTHTAGGHVLTGSSLFLQLLVAAFALRAIGRTPTSAQSAGVTRGTRHCRSATASPMRCTTRGSALLCS